MKIKYVKFSDERRKEFCIKTIIGQDNGQAVVYKEAIYEEGIGHIESIASNADKLKEYYDAEVCGAHLKDKRVYFEFITGESLEKRYNKAMKSGDIGKIEQLLMLHKSIVVGKKDNVTTYKSNGLEHEVFGDCSIFDGKEALKLCNYDAISSNIFFENDIPVFIDYEWVFEGPVPVDVVVYHVILEYYKHHPLMEEVYSFVKAMKLLGINEDMIEVLEKTYNNFYNFVITDGNSEGFALMKEICRKNTSNIYEDFHKIEHENLVNLCESRRLQGVIDDLIEENTTYAMRCEIYDKGIADYENKCINYEKQIEEYKDALEKMQAKLFCFGSRKLLRKIKGVYHRIKG